MCLSDKPDSMERDAITMTVAKNIEVLMDKMGVSTADLQRRAGLNHSALYDIMNGRSQSPRLATIFKIAEEGLGVPTWVLLRDPEENALDDNLNFAMLRLPVSKRREFLLMAQALADEADRQSAAQPSQA